LALAKYWYGHSLQVGRLMVSSPVTTSVRRPAAQTGRLVRSQGCDRAVVSTAWPGVGHTRTLCRVSRRDTAIDTGTESVPASPSRALLRCVRRKQSTLPWKSLARGRWRSRHMAFARVLTLRLAVPSRTPAGPGTESFREGQGGRGHFTDRSSTNTCRACVCLGGWAAPPWTWNAHAT